MCWLPASVANTTDRHNPVTVSRCAYRAWIFWMQQQVLAVWNTDARSVIIWFCLTRSQGPRDNEMMLPPLMPEGLWGIQPSHEGLCCGTEQLDHPLTPRVRGPVVQVFPGMAVACWCILLVTGGNPTVACDSIPLPTCCSRLGDVFLHPRWQSHQTQLLCSFASNWDRLRASEQWDNDWHCLVSCAAAECLLATSQSLGMGITPCTSVAQFWLPEHDGASWLSTSPPGPWRGFRLAGAITA